MEEWRDVIGYEGIYKISDSGRVMNRKGMVLKQSINPKGYYYVSLMNGKTKKRKTIHRMVAEAFIENPQCLPCVNHKDETHTNNHVDNLEWCTYRHNNVYGSRLDKVARKLGREVEQIDLTDGGVVAVFESTAEAGREVANARQTGVFKCCAGEMLTHAGYGWRYR